MSPNFEYIAEILGDYCDLQTDGVVPAASRYPVSNVMEQIALLSRVEFLLRHAEGHRQDCLVWEKTMMQAVGEDGPSDVIKAIDKIKAERDAALAQVESLLDDRKEFVKKEFQLLKEIERLEIELKKRDEQNAALAAKLSEIRTAWDEVGGYPDTTADFEALRVAIEGRDV